MNARLVIVILLLGLAAFVGSGAPGSAADCGCLLVGAYKDPESKAPRVNADGTSPNGVFRVSASSLGNLVDLTIRRVSNNSIVKTFSGIPSNAGWGFSPDDSRFVYHYQSGTVHNIVLYDLAGNRQVWTSAESGSLPRLAFSPHGKYLLHASVTSSNFTSLSVVDAVAGTLAHQSQFAFQSPPGSPGDSFGTVHWGFSPDPDDQTFVYGYITGQSSVQWNVVNLATRSIVKSETITDISAFWQFSPCGDAIGIVQQSSPTFVGVRLIKTGNGLELGSVSGIPIAAVTLSSTSASHVATIGGSNHVLASNTADNACPAGAALSSLTVTPTAVTGGANTTGKVILTAAAPSGGLVVNLSSSSVSATVPGSITVLAGQTSRTFSVATSSVSAVTPVTLTAAAGGVSKTASLTLNPAQSLASITVNPASVPGGTGSTGTIVLGGPAPSGGAVVSLSSSAPTVASVPASVLVLAGATSRTFAIGTSPVSASTDVTITASVGGASLTATLTVTAAPSQSPNAVVSESACLATELPQNDDGSTGAVAVGFPVNFFGTTYTHLYVNNNGNVTFEGPLSTYTPFTLTANVPPIIAPFLGDVDTSGVGSDTVKYGYGTTIFAGRPAFCVNWVNVGYYSGHADKLNSFQLLLVDRADTGAGNFDIVMNYDRILWETGDASGGSNGFGGSSAGAGYSAGTGDATAFFEFPGSLVNGALLDSNSSTGLTRTSRNSLQRGRHVFEVRNGAAPAGGSISGLVSDNASPANALVGAPVQVCPSSGGRCVFITVTNGAGRYNATGLPDGDYIVTARAPAGSSLAARTVGPITIASANSVVQDIALTGPVGPPAGTTITPSSTAGGIPRVYWGDQLDLTTQGCAGGSASYEISRGGTVIASGTMTEGPSGTYSASIPPLRPNSGLGHVTISIDCPEGTTDETIEFDIYIDPSGTVRTVSGNPIQDAVVTLYRADSAAGPFEIVPEGSAVMSPENRTNPDLTDGNGRFHWDVMAGFYKVRAEKEGCTSPSGSEAFVETDVLPVPPEWTDLDLRLACGGEDVAVLDHFKCYETKQLGTRFDPRQVTLTDQFNTERVNVLRPEAFCAPVDKDGSGINEPTGHLSCYKIRDVPGDEFPEFIKQPVDVTDQFGTHTLLLKESRSLCLPASKAQVAEVPGPTPTGLDHFKCYETKQLGTRFDPRQVTLTDQFNTERVNVLRPEAFCAPVDKDGSGINDATADLACYEIRDVRGDEFPKFEKRRVEAGDQFGTHSLLLKKTRTLCLPSSNTIL